MSLVRIQASIKTGNSPFKIGFKLGDNGIYVVGAICRDVKGSFLSPNHCNTTTLTFARNKKAIHVRHRSSFLVRFSFIQLCLCKEDNFGSSSLHKFKQHSNCPGVPKPPIVPSKGNHCSQRCCKVVTTDILSREEK